MSRRQARGAKAHKAGHLAESLAALWLMLKGYRILARRYRTPVGEIDLVIRRGPVIAYVEVKSRPTRDQALHAVPPKTRARIARAAAWYSQRLNMTGKTERFDLVAISPWRLPHHLVNAWELDL
ncbi:YraN family protein [Govanella unica]|uniref:UPF0102 protein NYP16_11875 n=1 Tax=Govanella unica TaxID=2975056 RepID=A0A9X3U0K6_9PROT|nr:YraN family protein [Govania unica]MDA5194649.1 YraN family protein [Govania unica]